MTELEHTSPHAIRGKTELLYREMLIEGTKLAQQNAEMLARQQALVEQVQAYQRSIDSAGAAAAQRLRDETQRMLNDFDRTVKQADHTIDITIKAHERQLAAIGLANAWKIATLCLLSGFIGAFGGALALTKLL